jgi:hypothetical protein
VSYSPERRLRLRLARIASLAASLFAGALLCRPPLVSAAAPLTDDAARMSEQSFALLATLNAQSAGGNGNPLLGPLATFASDTETLKRALATDDAVAQARAVNTLAADCATIDGGLKAHPTALKADDWSTIRGELDSIARAVARSTAGKIPAAPSAAGGTTVAGAPPVAPVAPAAASAPPASAAAAIPPPASLPNPPHAGAPVVKIASRTFSGDVVRIKGYIEGTALKSAGIYQNGSPLRTFQVSDVPGEQKIDLDIGIASPPPGAILRVTDASGRSAEAPILASEPALPPSAASAASLGANASDEGGVEVFRDNPARAGASAGTEDRGPVADIPSHTAPVPAAPRVPSPSRRHTLGGQLANVQIDVLGVTQTATAPPSYEVVGLINGQGVTHAGIYVDGRLVKTLPIEDGDNFTNFDERFVMNGNAATIRAYGAGNQFVESSVDLADGLGSIQPLPPGPFAYAGHPSAPGIGVLITAVRPGAGNIYTVAGTVSGANIASAGLYQNGVLAQAIALNGGLGGMVTGGGGLGGMLGTLIPGVTQSTNFNLRFNPAAGYASIRAYDRTGNYTEQPIMGNGMNPYGAVNPYGLPYGAANGNPAVNPYGTPYGVGTNPYGGTTNPYVIGRPGSPSSRPLW